ncbi:MAG: VOC family protein [Planctomycetota bacterium]
MRRDDPEISFLICVTDLEKARRFYEAVLEVEARVEGEGVASCLHLRPSNRRWEITCVAWPGIHEAAPHLFPAEKPSSFVPGTSLRMYVADVDAVFARALAAGGLAVDEPSTREDGVRIGRLRDPEGHLVTLLTRRKRG